MELFQVDGCSNPFGESGSKFSERLVLAPDTAFMPERDLRQHLHRAAGCEPGDWVVSRKHGRAASIVISEELELLLRGFLRPVTMNEAVENYCAVRGLNVATVLARTGGPISRMKTLGYLRAPQESIDCQDMLAPKGVWRDPVLIQDLDGAQVFRVEWQRQTAVLKVGPAGSTQADVASVIQREAEILKQLPQGSFPKFFDAGTANGRDYLLASWFEGADALSNANYLRRLYPNDLLLICARILDCYAALEGAGWLHADVHPRNVIVGSGSDPKLIDFGQAYRANQPRTHARAGIAYFFDPQYATALLNKTTIPYYDSVSEQYALAALLHLLITGYHYQDFALERREMLRQIIDGAPLAFSAHQNPSRPAVEVVLGHALRKTPEERFPTIASFAECFRASLSERRSIKTSSAKTARGGFAHGPISQLAWDGPQRELRTLAEAAVHDGAAGLAYAQYRLALLKQSPLLLGSSEIWISRALSALRTLRDRSYGAGEKVFRGSLHHGPPGIHCVAALIATAQGNLPTAIRSAKGFLQAIPDHTATRDMTHGLAGCLVGCAILMESLYRESSEEILSALRQKGETLAQAVWVENENDSQGYAEERGIAHGETGRLYACLRWSQALQTPPSSAVVARVAAIFCDRKRPRTAKFARTPRGSTGAAFVRSSWCNGGAGHVLLLLLTAAAAGERQFATRAAEIAEATWRDRAITACLCCGLSGRAFAMLSMARATQSRAWVKRAAKLVQRSEAGATSLGTGLYKGRAGVELARIELAEPKSARMPLFE
jgi:eukaryotic-like serine/threonine-protein kinase